MDAFSYVFNTSNFFPSCFVAEKFVTPLYILILEGGLPSTVPISETVVLSGFDTPYTFLLSTPI